jgi:hypothetical protein
MNEDRHNIDDLFRSALQHYEETPSPAVKENLNIQLAKQDAVAYKRKYATWKRIAILFMMLLTGIIVYVSGILKPAFNHSKENSIIKKSGTTEMSLRQKTKNTPRRSFPEIAGQRPLFVNRKVNNTIKNNHTGIIVTSSKHDKNVSDSLNKKESLPNEKTTLAASNKIISADIIDFQLMNNIRQIPDLDISDATIKKSVAKKQKRNKASIFKPYWTITGAASYEQVNYKLDSDLPNAINSIMHREEHEPSFSGGILTARQLKKHLGLQTGLIYSYTTIGISPQKIYAFQEPAGSVAFKYITSSGYAYIKPGSGAPPSVGDSLNTAEAEHTLQSLSVPLIFKYSIENNKFSFRPGAGIEANLLTSAKVEVEIEETPNSEIVFINKLNGAKSFYWSLTADAELQYKANKKMTLTLRPAFRYALSPITEDNVVETFPYSFGLGIGVTYKLR